MQEKFTLYEQLNQDKARGKLMPWTGMTEELLFRLYSEQVIIDSMVAKLFDVSISKVRYLKQKYRVSQSRIMAAQIAAANGFAAESGGNLSGKFTPDGFSAASVDFVKGSLLSNDEAQRFLLSKENADAMAIALAHYIFRDGPIEDMHAKGQLSTDDMKQLNKFMADQIATLLYLAENSHWKQLHFLLFLYLFNGEHWDAPEMNQDTLRFLFRDSLTDEK